MCKLNKNWLLCEIQNLSNDFIKLSTPNRLKTNINDYETKLINLIKHINSNICFLYKVTPKSLESKSSKFNTYWFSYNNEKFYIVISTKDAAGMKAERIFDNDIKNKKSSLYSQIENRFNIKLNEYEYKSTGSLNCKRSDVNSMNIGHLVADYKIWNNSNIFNFSIKQGNEYNIFSGSSIDINENSNNWTDINKNIFNFLHLDLCKIREGLNNYSKKIIKSQEIINVKLNNNFKEILRWLYGYGYHIAHYNSNWSFYDIMNIKDLDNYIGNINHNITIRYPYYVNDKKSNKSTSIDIDSYSKLLKKNVRIKIQLRDSKGGIYNPRFTIYKILKKQ